MRETLLEVLVAVPWQYTVIERLDVRLVVDVEDAVLPFLTVKILMCVGMWSSLMRRLYRLNDKYIISMVFRQSICHRIDINICVGGARGSPRRFFRRTGPVLRAHALRG